ncbi:hypothetical protein [Aerococcus urinaeequi]|uniref:hypothetical protein n=1 Tax=Aerococcus urinaeequi TaxID=51665 RepID=UPI003EC7FE5B
MNEPQLPNTLKEREAKELEKKKQIFQLEIDTEKVSTEKFDIEIIRDEHGEVIGADAIVTFRIPSTEFLAERWIDGTQECSKLKGIICTSF